MPFGYAGKILKINLSEKSFSIEEKDEKFYRSYLGGGGLGAYYLLKEMKAGTDPLSPENIIVFASGLGTGIPAAGLPRFGVVTKSPLTGRIGDSQAGGFWGPELKAAGYDAVVITGKAEKLTYLWIENGEVEFKSAGDLKGLSPYETQEKIRTELGDNKIRVASIGLAGENLVRYALIMNENSATGRLGMGAVMGSKNLKAIAVRGTEKVALHDKQKIIERAQWFSQNFKENPDNYGLSVHGTEHVTEAMHTGGQLPTRNFQEGQFEDVEKLYHNEFDKIKVKQGNCCYACPVNCRKHIYHEGEISIKPEYGAPEYEGVGALGSNCGIGDTLAVAKSSELCNKYGMDVVSTGATIAFAMECYEKELITDAELDGLDLRFGNVEAALSVIDKIARREGVGDVLAEGSMRVAKKWGKETEAYAMQVKGQELPMHDPRGKGMVGFGYAVFGADHVIVEHDPDFDENAPQLYMDQIKCLGLYDRIENHGMTPYKVKMFTYLQYQWSFFDCIGACVHAFSPIRTFTMRDMITLLDAATGWEMSLWELMKAGERRVNMFRLFNLREGFTAKDDVIPERFFEEPIPEGPLKGQKVDRAEFEAMKELYYQLMGWDGSTGVPLKAKRYELDLDWVEA